MTGKCESRFAFWGPVECSGWGFRGGSVESPQYVRGILSAGLLLVAACSPSPSDTGTDPGDPDRDAIPPEEALGVVWEEVTGNPLLPLPTCPDWHCLGQTDPSVHPVPGSAAGEYRIWFSTGGDLGGPVVGRAVLDDRVNLRLEPADRPVLELRDDRWDRYRETVDVRWDPEEERWTLWYLGYETSFFQDAGLGQIHSLDPDGTVWDESPAPIYQPEEGGWDHAFITSPHFVETPEGEWRLYYAGAGTTIGIGILRSFDRGQTWEPHPDNPVFERDLEGWDQGMLHGMVRQVGRRYLMWYSGYEEPLDLDSTPIYVGLALSDDGVRWERSPHNPVLGPGSPGSWNDLRVVSPYVVKEEDGSLLLFAHGQSRADIGRSLGLLGVWRSPAP